MSKKLTKAQEAQRVARWRAFWNRNGGGVLLTPIGGKTQCGVAWRCLVDGGNRWGGRYRWVAGSAHGGGYDVRGAAMAVAVRGIVAPELEGINTRLDGGNRGHWREVLAEIGWTCYDYGEDASIILIPMAKVAEKIGDEIVKEQEGGAK